MKNNSLDDNSQENNHSTILNGEFYFNVILHIFILFTILHLLFKLYISNITTNAIASEFNHIINGIFKNIDKEKFLKNVDDYKNSYNTYINLFQNYKEFNDNISVISFLKDKYNINSVNDLVTIISNKGSITPSSSIKPTTINNLFSVKPQTLNEMSKLFAENFTFSYYDKIFLKPEPYREKINKIVFKNIAFINFFLFFILILFTMIMVKSKILTFDEIKYVISENSITFFFVGIIEIIFFIKIASKYIPTKPSSIYTLLLSNLKEQLA